ncbi:Arc-like DNA binding domain-containing protein [Methylomagnum ishizawai]|uniref:Arc-like DNA binding domain-containing protein n=1 Tax=Methylomagnum ishizawai TaxID=1760988 RepID=A0A1Y6CUG7_9GAMM|nr:Arc family DNA-binding protein [Methylomagnum ishizawai]SMF93936.1 Arc-like DNA binding domain-containing protein [Methylomagnum ishizawai]
MSREAPQMKIRLPEDLKARIEESAYQNRRSMNAEIVARLEASYAPAASELKEYAKDQEERLASMLAEKLRADFKRLEEEIRKNPVDLSKLKPGTPLVIDDRE